MHDPDAKNLAILFASKAQEDEIVVHKAFIERDIPDQVVMFHGQQAVEKYLKAVLALNGVNFKRSHNIAYLNTLLDQSDLPGPACRNEIEGLTPWASDARYSDLVDAQPDLDEVAALVHGVSAWAHDHIGPTDAPSAVAANLRHLATEAGADHMILLSRSEREAGLVHVTVDGTAWIGRMSCDGMESLMKAISAGHNEGESWDGVLAGDSGNLGTMVTEMAKVMLKLVSADEIVVLSRWTDDHSFSWWHIADGHPSSGDFQPDSISALLLKLDELSDVPLALNFEKPDPDVRLSVDALGLDIETKAMLVRLGELDEEEFAANPDGSSDTGSRSSSLSEQQFNRLTAIADEIGATQLAKERAAEIVRKKAPDFDWLAPEPEPANIVPIGIAIQEASKATADSSGRILVAAVQAWAEGHLAAPGHPPPGETEKPNAIPPFPNPDDHRDRLAQILDEVAGRFAKDEVVAALHFAGALGWQAGFEAGAACDGCSIAKGKSPLAQASRAGRLSFTVSALKPELFSDIEGSS